MNSAAVLDVLALARAFVEAGWCQGLLAADGDGHCADPIAPAAVQFCAVGALERARLELAAGSAALWAAEDLLAGAVPGDSEFRIAHYNDRPGRKKRDVLRLFERAAAKIGK